MENKLVSITGFNGSIGGSLVDVFASRDWDVYKWDLRDVFSEPPQADVLILSHGGDHEKMEEVFEKNVFSFRGVIKHLESYLKPDGALILLSSRRAILPTEEELDYSASKAAAHAYVRGLYKSHPNLRITCICPGWVESEMADTAHAKRVISKKDLSDLIYLVGNSTSMRIPEILIEPIGDSEF